MHAVCWLVETHGLLYRCGLGLLIVKHISMQFLLLMILPYWFYCASTLLLMVSMKYFLGPKQNLEHMYTNHPCCWNIKFTKRVLEISVYENILLGHALLGCNVMYCMACVTPEKIATAGERACIVVAKGQIH